MGKKLLIVESPAKSRTINKYLGKDFEVTATMGHIVDLPKSRIGVDIDNNFQPEYEIIDEKKKIVSELKKKAAKADEIYLAADPDREGEAICYHLNSILKKKGRIIKRVLFNEITKKSIIEAVKNPGNIDENKFDSQQTRRIVDRLVGYKVSPLLWEKVKRGLSAGRVQTVALRIICEREEAIRNFPKEEYWNITADFETKEQEVLETKLTAYNGKKVRNGNKKTAFSIESKEQADSILDLLAKEKFTVKSVEKKQRKRNPLPPFITSKLQQEASRLLDFKVKKTMMTAQRLYEGISVGEEGMVGLITYMRTDSVRISEGALNEARDFLSQNYPEKLPSKPRFFATKGNAQDAHEAIRPTSVFRTPEKMKKYLKKDELALYSLIWKRFVASQMTEAIMDETIITVSAKGYDFTASGTVVVDSGFTEIYNPGITRDKFIPKVNEKDNLPLMDIKGEQAFTQPPARFTEATLVKELESNGIGRPSTYASIISVIQNRAYVIQKEKKFHPTHLGELVNKILTEAFPKIFEINYTAELESLLDKIETGDAKWLEVLKTFYIEFAKQLENAKSNMLNVKAGGIPTGEKCSKCGAEMVKKVGKYGIFLACTNYPECTNTKDLSDNGDTKTDKKCSKCGAEMVIKTGKYGQFYACSAYPECKNIESLEQDTPKETGKNCPKCGSPLVEKKGRYGRFIACSAYPECKHIEKNIKQLDITCPTCNEGKIVMRKTRRGKTFYGCSKYPKCDYASWKMPTEKNKE
jgi:DNA topoisomerase-1